MSVILHFSANRRPARLVVVHQNMQASLGLTKCDDWRKNLPLHQELKNGFKTIEQDSESLIQAIDELTDKKLKYETAG